MSSPESVILSGAQRSRRIPWRNLSVNTSGSLDSARDDESAEPVANPRAIEVHIDELILHGFELGDRYRIGEAVEHELARLLCEQGVPLSLHSENATDELKAPTFSPTPGAKPPAIGRQIAQAVYKGFSQ